MLKSWAQAPRQVWTINNLGAGYGSLAVKGIAFSFRSGFVGQHSVLPESTDGKVIWQTALGPKLDEGRGNGPRGTPTIDVDRLYVLTEAGDLACLKVRDGSSVWRKIILKEYQGENPNWLISESPLVDGDHLIVTPGGRDSSIVAMDKMTGKTVWQSKGLSDSAHYSSCIAADVGGPLHHRVYLKGKWESRIRRQVDVEVSTGSQWHCERCDSGLLRQQGFLYLHLQHWLCSLNLKVKRRGKSRGSVFQS